MSNAIGGSADSTCSYWQYAVPCMHCWHAEPRKDCNKYPVKNYETRCCKCGRVQ